MPMMKGNKEGKPPVLIKKDIVKAVSRLTKFAQDDVDEIVNATFYVMRTFLENAPVGSWVHIRDFLRIKVTKKPGGKMTPLGMTKVRRRLQLRPSKYLAKKLEFFPTLEDFLNTRQ